MECKIVNDQIFIQKIICRILMQQNKSHFKKLVNYASFTNIDQVKSIFGTTENNWIFSLLKNEEKDFICELIVNDNDIDFLQNFVEIRYVFEKIVLLEYKQIAECFSKSKNSTLTQIDFSKELVESDIAELIAIDQSKVKKCSVDKIRNLLGVLSTLPVPYCSKATKTKIALIHLCLYKDLIAADEIQLSQEVLEMLVDYLHFGETILLHKYIGFKTFNNLIPPQKYAMLYTNVLNNLKFDMESGKKFMSRLVSHIKKMDQKDDQFFELLNLSISYLSSPSATKDTKQYLEDLYAIVWKNIEEYFNENTETNMEATSAFVVKSLPSFSNYFHSFFNKLEQNTEMEENMRKICKVYLGNSIFHNNPHALKLMTTAYNNRVVLHLDSDEIEFLLQRYWNQMAQDFKDNYKNIADFDKVAKMVINNQSNEDFLKMLKSYEKNLDDNVHFVCQIFLLILSCNLSKIKGAILNEEFKQISSKIMMSFSSLKEDWGTILTLIECQTCLCKNLKIPISLDTIDDILMFISNLKVNQIIELETESALFFKIHQAISDLCISMMKNRHILLLDRIPQVTNIFSKQLELVCFYKCDRQKDINLSNEELDNLKNSFLKLESLMHLIASHGVEFKRVAPYTLTFAINLLVSNRRSTTLYPKIKAHVENICYDLIKICDHRVGRFILRNSNEASRQVYEVLNKDYIKYHKFKGKI